MRRTPPHPPAAAGRAAARSRTAPLPPPSCSSRAARGGEAAAGECRPGCTHAEKRVSVRAQGGSGQPPASRLNGPTKAPSIPAPPASAHGRPHSPHNAPNASRVRTCSLSHSRTARPSPPPSHPRRHHRRSGRSDALQTNPRGRHEHARPRQPPVTWSPLKYGGTTHGAAREQLPSTGPRPPDTVKPYMVPRLPAAAAAARNGRGVGVGGGEEGGWDKVLVGQGAHPAARRAARALASASMRTARAFPGPRQACGRGEAERWPRGGGDGREAAAAAVGWG